LQLAQQRAGNTLEAIGIGKDFLSRTQAAQQLRERMDKWDYMKLNTFSTTKEMVSLLKTPSTECDKIFASYVSDKGLITRIYRELKKTKLPKSQWTNKEVGNWTKQNFFKKVQIAKKHTEKCLPLLAIKEMQIKTTLRYHLTSVTNNKCWQGCGEKRKPHTMLVGM
jgi:hypothetical protein